MQIPIDKHLFLEADLEIPKGAIGLVIFAHGSGSSRKSPRNRHVAKTLQQGRLATLLIDLLTLREEKEDVTTAHLRFNIKLLTERLCKVTQWAVKDKDCKELAIGYFGASTGAAAALAAAALNQDRVKAVVSRGGRPDLAISYLPQVKAPTLLIVGGFDEVVIGMNEEAYKHLQCEKKLEIVPGATHLFEESGALDQVAQLALTWFSHNL